MLDEHLVVDDVAYLKRQAERCSRLAASIDDRRASAVLETMADEFERMAERRAACEQGEAAAPCAAAP